MYRSKKNHPLSKEQAKDIKQRMLNWASQFDILVFLDSNSYTSAPGKYECILAAGKAHTNYTEDGGEGYDKLQHLQRQHDQQKDWMFGHIGYDFKNELEPKLFSRHEVNTGFSPFEFFVPETVVYIGREQPMLTIETYGNADSILDEIKAAVALPVAQAIPRLQFESRMGKSEYLENIERLRQHIAQGDCYEINYCKEGFCKSVSIDPLQVFRALNELSPAPFAAYYRNGNRYMMCASPERYLRKTGSQLLSQPIKGTAGRGADKAADDVKKAELRNSIKEQAENVMITDLTRNDLSRVCETGSIRVDELYGIYTFPHVHQMISTVSGTKRGNVPFTDAIRYSFPMGSMTGAPKFKVMELIGRYEYSRRELFSGTIGYIEPGGDFDFNVIIRSLFYDESAGYLSYQTGGAITYDSNPEQEWEELRLKAWAIERIFS